MSKATGYRTDEKQTNMTVNWLKLTRKENF